MMNTNAGHACGLCGTAPEREERFPMCRSCADPVCPSCDIASKRSEDEGLASTLCIDCDEEM